MPDSKDRKMRFIDGPSAADLPITQEAREIAAAYLTKENERTGVTAYDVGVVGEVLAGKRDYAPAVKIAQFTLNRAKVTA